MAGFKTLGVAILAAGVAVARREEVTLRVEVVAAKAVVAKSKHIILESCILKKGL